MKRTRAKRSPIWKIDRDELAQIVAQSTTGTDICNHFGLRAASGQMRTLFERIRAENIPHDHIPRGRSSGKGIKRGGTRAFPLEQVLVKGSTYARTNLKRRLLEAGLLRNQCYDCGQGPTWNGRPLSLQIDHKNGVANDNRLDNLQMLCPNCHSQTETFAGKNARKLK